MRESWASLVPWPCVQRFLYRGPQCRVLCIRAFCRVPLLVHWLSGFSTAFCEMFSRVSTVARGEYMTNHIKEEHLLYGRSGKDQDKKRGQTVSTGYIQGDKFARNSDTVSHMCIRNLKCFHKQCHAMGI